MSRSRIVFSKDRMVDDCCSHMCFVLYASYLDKVTSSRHKVPTPRHKTKAHALSQSKVNQAYGNETSPSRFMRLSVYFRP
jgi:hypothetical protein